MKVRKRTGDLVNFNPSKIKEAISLAFESKNYTSEKPVIEVYEAVIEKINENYSYDSVIDIEEIQNLIEKCLVEHDYYEVFISFSTYRRRKAEERERKKRILGKEKLTHLEKKIPLNSLEILSSRYLWKDFDEKGNVVGFKEDLPQFFVRVSLIGAIPELLFDFFENPVEKNYREIRHDVEDYDKKVYELIKKLLIDFELTSAELFREEEAFTFKCLDGKICRFSVWHIERLLSMLNRFSGDIRPSILQKFDDFDKLSLKTLKYEKFGVPYGKSELVSLVVILKLLKTDEAKFLFPKFFETFRLLYEHISTFKIVPNKIGRAHV